MSTSEVKKLQKNLLAKSGTAATSNLYSASTSQIGGAQTADQTSALTRSRAQTAGRFHTGGPLRGARGFKQTASSRQVGSGYMDPSSRGEIEIGGLLSTREDDTLEKIQTMFGSEALASGGKQRPHTSKRVRPNIKSMTSIQNLQKVKINFGPASTKNMLSHTGGFGALGGGVGRKNAHANSKHTNTHRNRDDQKEDTISKLFETSYNHDPAEKVVSVAERSILSQNFIHGTEDSVSTVVGVTKEVSKKPLAYGEFKRAVKRESDVSTALTHGEFIWEVSRGWQAMRDAKFKSIGLNSFKKAQEENQLILFHELQDDIYFRENQHLKEFKKKNYIDPDLLAVQRAPKTVTTNKLIKDSTGFEFGLYKRFDWESPQIQHAIRMGTAQAAMNQTGPGSYHNPKARSKGNQGMFDRSKRDHPETPYPGPGFYFQNGQVGPEEQADKFTFPRAYRKLPGEQTGPDYNKGVYNDKGPSVKPKIGGYTFPECGGTDKSEDPSKKMFPGVGAYETEHAYKKSTFFKNPPCFSVPVDGAYSIEAVLSQTHKYGNKRRGKKAAPTRQEPPNIDLD